MKHLGGVFVSPLAVFSRLRELPRWFLAFTCTAGCFFLLAWLGGCWRNLSQGLEPSSLLSPALISPLIVGIVSLSTTALIYLLSRIVGREEARFTRFRSLYSVNIHCGLIFLLGEIVNFLLIRTSLLGDYTPPLRGRFPVGLDLFLLGVDDPSLYLSMILHSTSIFLIWYLVVLSLGISTVTGLSRKKSAAIVMIVWCVAVGMALGAVYAAGGQTTIRIKI
jgi:hypothetical protein